MRFSTTLLFVLLSLTLTSSLAQDATTAPSSDQRADPATTSAPESKNEAEAGEDEKEGKSWISKVIPIVVVVLIVVVVGSVCLYCFKRKRQDTFVEAVMQDQQQFNEAI